jgi:signal peptidase II
VSDKKPAKTASEADGGPKQTPGKIALFAAVAVGMTVLDQVTKIWIRNNLELYYARTGVPRSEKEITVIDGWLSIIHAENPGAAFGFLNDSPYRMYVFAGFTVVALVVLGRMFFELPADDRFQNVALGMVVSGAIGNAIDRVLYQSVTDFVKMYTEHPTLAPWLKERLGSAEWPTYNVADVAIVVGLVMFGIHYLFLEKDEEVPPDPPDKALDPDAKPADSKGAPVAPVAAPPKPAPVVKPDVPEDQLDEFAEQKTEAMQPVAPAPKRRNLADLGDD